MRRLIDLGVADWVQGGREIVAPVLDALQSLPASCPSYPQASNGKAFAFRNALGELVYCETDQVPPFPKRESVRLHGPCITSRCVHWSGHCSLGAVLSRADGPTEEPEPIGEERYLACRIQEACRWKGENGLAACRACASVDYFVSS